MIIHLIPAIKLVVLMVSLIAHELGHGYAAAALGDNTAEKQGRLTLNPAAHMDLAGSVLLPFVFNRVFGFIVGWGKPMPIDRSNLSRLRFIVVMFSGILANLCLALLSLAFYLATKDLVTTSAPMALQAVCTAVFLLLPVNLMLVVFNLIPLPPLDGWLMATHMIPGKPGAGLSVLQKRGVVTVSFVVAALVMTWLQPYINHVVVYLVKVT